MLRDFYLDREHRNEYLVFMLRILEDKYLINRPKLARAIGLNPSYFADVVDGRRGNMNHPNMDKIEFFINDLYEPILRDEIDLNYLYLKSLSKRSVKE